MRIQPLLIALLLPFGHAMAETVVIKGSNTFGEELGPRLMDAYRAEQPGVEFILERAGTPSGVAALFNGECDLAAASRMLTEDEQRTARSRKFKVRTHTIGYYGLAVIVSDELDVRGLSLPQVRDLFTGAVSNWSAVGGPDRPVTIVVHDPSSGTRLGFQELAMENRPYSSAAVECDSYQKIAETVAASDRAIGYIAQPFLDHTPGLRSIRINGVAPTPVAIVEGLYPLARRVRFFTIRGKEAPAAMKFVGFVRSARGQSVLDELGFVRWTQRYLTPSMEVP